MTLFKKRVKNYLFQSLDREELWYQIGSGILTALIEHCFTFEGGSKEQKAVDILSSLFSLITADGEETFLHFYAEIPKKSEQKKFLTLILFSLYYNDLRWERLITQRGFHIQLLQWFASVGSPQSIKKLLGALPTKIKEEVFEFAEKYLDEGGFALCRFRPKQKLVDFDLRSCREGLQKMVFALPTCDKELKGLAWLSSMVEGIKEVCSLIQDSLLHYPLFVFDQSQEGTFKKNKRYIEELVKKEGVAIIHLNTTQILELAEKLHVKKLIQPYPKGYETRFGYGGSRNTVFLLAPALLAKCRDHKPLCLQEDYVIYMGDDDVYVPPEALVSNALFVKEHINEYFCRFSYVLGRDTQKVVGCLRQNLVASHPQEVILQNCWKETPFLHGISGILCKPKLCLNTPHGQEEAFFQSMTVYKGDERYPLLHLAGRRYPKACIPMKRTEGFASFLKKQNTYTLQLLQIAHLLDPLNLQKKSPLVWNEQKKPFASFFEALRFMSKPQVIKEVRARFWNNFLSYSQEVQKYYGKGKDIRALQAFCSYLVQSKDKKATLEHMEKLYGPGFDLLPATYSLYVLCRTLGLSEFQNELKNLEKVGLFTDVCSSHQTELHSLHTYRPILQA